MKEEPSDHTEQQFEKHLRDMLRKASLGFGPAAATEPAPAPEPPSKAGETLERIRAFSLRPREVRDYLDRFVVKQDEG